MSFSPDYQPAAGLLQDRVILVTGASDGIGAEAAKQYAALGATVILHGRSLAKLEAVYDEIEKAGGAQPAIVPLDLSTATADGAVLIAGAGHARTDRGVPWVLAQLPKSKGQKTFSLGFVEVAAGATDPSAYAAAYGGKALPFDAVWFTPALDDEDPCAGMK